MLDDIKILCWNVGRGEATIMCSQNVAHIIDFGSTALPKHYIFAINTARKIIQQHNRVTAVITHFHYDHYSLIPHVVESKTIDTVFVPGIPFPKPIAEMVCYLLAVQAILLHRRGQVILDDIAKRTRKVYFAYRGTTFKLTSNLHAHVLWPPPRLPPSIAKKVIRKLKPAYEKAKKLVEKANIVEQVGSKASELYERIKSIVERVSARNKQIEAIEADSEFLSSLPTLAKIETLREDLPKDAEEDTKESELLAFIRDALNDMSLVLKYYYRDKAFAVIPGDNSNSVLDYLSILQRNEQKFQRHVVFLRGSHHGTYFGKYLEETKAAIAWLSWTSMLHEPPHLGYFHTADIVVIAEYVHELRLTIHSCSHCQPYLYLIASRNPPRTFDIHVFT